MSGYDKRRQDTRHAIVVSARKHMLEIGFDACTMTSIAKCYGGSKSTVFSNFKSKKDILVSIFEDLSLELHEEIVRHFSECKINDKVAFLCEFVECYINSIKNTNLDYFTSCLIHLGRCDDKCLQYPRFALNTSASILLSQSFFNRFGEIKDKGKCEKFLDSVIKDCLYSIWFKNYISDDNCFTSQFIEDFLND